MTPPPPEPPGPAALARRSQPAARTVQSHALVEDELGPSLTSAQLMRAPLVDRQLPDLSVSNEALLASLRPAVENTLSARASRVAHEQGQRALYWFGTRPSWLQATLSVVGGSIVGLSLVVAYAKTFHTEAEPEVAAEPAGPARGVALAAAAAPAALLAQRVAPLAAAPAPAKAEGAGSTEPAADEAATGDGEPPRTEADGEAASQRRKSGKRQRATSHEASPSSGKLPSWVQRQVKPQVQRAAARERKAAARERRAAARERRARRSRARAREQE